MRSFSSILPAVMEKSILNLLVFKHFTRCYGEVYLELIGLETSVEL